MGKYEDTIIQVFNNKLDDGYNTEEEIPFDRTDLQKAMDELDITVRNVPDIPYAYRSRRQLPDSLKEHGYNAIILDDQGSADAVYLFTKTEQLIEVPDEFDQTYVTTAEDLPEPVQAYIGKDEQGVLTQVRYTGLLDDFTGMDTYHLQSHLRMRVRNREAELDDFYVGVDEEDEHHALAVEAKGVGETLNKNQLIRNTRGIEQNSKFPNSVRTIAVKIDDNDFFYLFEFDVYEEDDEDKIEMERAWRYKFEE